MLIAKFKVWLVTTGDGGYGSAWDVINICATEKDALIAKAEYERPQFQDDGSTYHYDANIEDWEVYGEEDAK